MLENTHIFGIKKEWLLNGFFFLFLAIIIANRIWLFFTININCIDNDQPILWLGAKHYSQGLFYEPRFYGQDYNTMMESLFAVPFVKLGMPVYYAVPIATHIIYLVPFLFTASYLIIKKHRELAVMVLAILLCMPTGYDIMNSIPRGFVTGVFFTSLFVVCLLNTKNYKFILINTFMAYVGYLVNQNSVLVSAPFLCYLFLINYKDKKYYIYSVLGLLLALPIDYGLNHFYKIHPEYVFYPANNTFSIDYFKDAITHLDQRFAHISFFIEEKSFLIIFILFVIAGLLFKTNRKLFFSFFIFIAVLIVSFFSSKVSDGIVWPFYSYSRMYIGMPIIIYLLLLGSNINFKRSIYILIPVVLVFSVFKITRLTKQIAYHTQEKMWGHVHLNTLPEIIEAIDITKRICNEQGVNDFVIINSAWHDDEINYAGPAVYNDFPNTFKPSFERRTWRIKEEKIKRPNKFVIYTGDYNYDSIIKKQYKHVDINRINDYGMFIIKNNTLTTVDFVKSINASTEGF